MTAVVCSLGPVQRIIDAAPTISEAVVSALAAWAAAPLPHAVAHRAQLAPDQDVCRISTALSTHCV